MHIYVVIVFVKNSHFHVCP
jgi:ATP-dependent Lon protease